MKKQNGSRHFCGGCNEDAAAAAADGQDHLPEHSRGTNNSMFRQQRRTEETHDRGILMLR